MAGIALAAFPLSGAVPYAPETADPLLDAWRWQRFPELDAKAPQCLFEGAEGEMWFGLREGALRFDGVEWRHYGAAEGLPGLVSAFARTRDGTLHAATETGIFRLTHDRWTRFFPEDPNAKFAVTVLVGAVDGALWAGGKRSVFWAKGAERVFYAHPNHEGRLRDSFPNATFRSLPNNARGTIGNLMEDRDGRLWVYTVGGPMLRYNPATSPAGTDWQAFVRRHGYRATPGRYGAIRQMADGSIWVAARPDNAAAGGINRYDPATNRWNYIDLNAVVQTDALVKSVLETSDGAVWLGGQDKLIRRHGDRWRVYRAPEVPLSSSRFDLLESRQGDLWVLGVGDEVQRVDFRGQRWLEHKRLNFRCETPDGRQWFVAADDGVVSYDGQSWLRYGMDDGLMAKPCALLSTRGGELWAAGSHEDGDAAIARFDGTRWHRVPAPRENPAFNHAVAIDYRAIAEGADGSLWFGGYEGARVPRKNGFLPRGCVLQYNPALGPPHDERAWTLHIAPGGSQSTLCSFGFAVGRNGRVFSATYANAFQYDGQRWINFFKGQMTVDAICNTNSGDVWFGTQGLGLFRFNGRRTVNYTVADGLANNAITALFSDRDNHLWVGSGKGVSRFDGEEWITDAFPAERLTMGAEGGGFAQSRDGTLWINRSSRDWMRRTLPGGELRTETTGDFSTVRFRPDRAPPVTKITTALEQVSQPGNAVISWRAVDPWMRTAEADLRYSFRLDGGRWSKFTAATNHVLLELPPGRHTFEVRARDRDLNVEMAPARATFEVLPPVWRQPWFLSLLAVLLTAIAAQTWRVLSRDRLLLRANHDLRLEVDERKRIAAQLEKQTHVLEENKRQLEDEIVERVQIEKEVEKTHKQLLLASRQAGMAEVATSVLHNVGNVLTSINVSATVLAEQLRRIRPETLAKTADLLRDNAGAPGYLGTEKGKLIPDFLRTLGENLGSTRQLSLKELDWLRQNIEHVKEIVAMQQTYARIAGVTERVKLSELLDDALRMNAAALQRHEVKLERDIRDDPVIEVEKHNVLQILVNLLRNAKYACDETGRTDKRIVVRIERTAPERVAIVVSDNGVGIPPENITRIFNHGFTTRKDGHGFGLHSAANTAATMGGSLIARSDGPGQGATFVLDLPLVGGAGRSAPAAGPGDSARAHSPAGAEIVG